MNAVDVAREYLNRHWAPIPIPSGGKQPLLHAWQTLRLSDQDLPTYFGLPSNIGVLLGEPSRRLIDVDLDHPLSLELADLYLPPTGAVFGRASKRRSHWLYYSSRPAATRQWRLPNRQMIVELRSTRAQTVFPGSVHESGEPIEWDSNGEPAVVDPDVLRDQLQAISDDVLRRLGLSRRASNDDAARGAAAPPAVVKRARKYVSKVPPAVSGQGGHNATFHAACLLVIGFGLDRESALRLLREWNEACLPPWTNKELEHKVDDALKQPGWRGYLLARHRRLAPRCSNSAIERANRHAIEHRRRARRRARA